MRDHLDFTLPSDSAAAVAGTQKNRIVRVPHTGFAEDALRLTLEPASFQPFGGSSFSTYATNRALAMQFPDGTNSTAAATIWAKPDLRGQDMQITLLLAPTTAGGGNVRLRVTYAAIDEGTPGTSALSYQALAMATTQDQIAAYTLSGTITPGADAPFLGLRIQRDGANIVDTYGAAVNFLGGYLEIA